MIIYYLKKIKVKEEEKTRGGTEGDNGGGIFMCWGWGGGSGKLGYNISTKHMTHLSTIGSESILLHVGK